MHVFQPGLLLAAPRLLVVVVVHEVPALPREAGLQPERRRRLARGEPGFGRFAHKVEMPGAGD